MAKEPWEIQHERKYRDHDLPVEDLTRSDFDSVRSASHQIFRETPESDNVKIIVSAFIGLLTAKGYRITKKETP